MHSGTVIKKRKNAIVQFSCDNAVDLRICEIWHLKETAQKTNIDDELIFWPVSEFQRRCPAVQDPPCLLSSGSIAIGQFRSIRRRSGSVKAQCSRLHQERWKAGFFGQRSHQVWSHHIFFWNAFFDEDCPRTKGRLLSVKVVFVLEFWKVLSP